MDYRHEAQPRRPGRDVARRRVEPAAHRVRSTQLPVCGECTALQRQLDNVDKSRRRLPVLRAVAAYTGRPAARLLDVRGRCRVPPPRRFQRRRRLPTMARATRRSRSSTISATCWSACQRFQRH